MRGVDPEGAGWTTTDYLLASVIEMVDAIGWRLLLPHMGKKKPQPSWYVKVPRPGVEAEETPALRPGRPSPKYAQYVTYVPS